MPPWRLALEPSLCRCPTCAATLHLSSCPAGAWDKSFAVHRLQCSTGGSWELVQVFSEQTPGRVNAVEFLPPAAASPSSNGSDNGGSSANGSEDAGDGAASGGGPSTSPGRSSSTFLVAVQGSNYLRQLSIAPEAAAGADGGSSSSSSSEGAVVRQEWRIK